MNNNLALICNSTIEDLETLETKLNNYSIQIDNLSKLSGFDFSSDIEPIDVAFPIIYGAVGATIASSESLKRFLEQIHSDASSKNPKTLLGKILHHFDDRTDQAIINGEKIFIKRDGGVPELGSHRVMYGHDPFSSSSDNPFKVLTKQYGILNGIARVFQHLVADTFSKQGLPIPFHSFFDFYKPDGNLTNKLWELASKCASGVKTSGGRSVTKLEAFNHLFTINFSDIMTTGLTYALCMIHNKIRGFEDPVFRSQTKIIGLTSQFYIRAIIGLVKSGIPYISWPILPLLLKQIYTFFRANWADINRIESITKNLVQKNIEIESMVFNNKTSYKSYNNGVDYINELDSDFSGYRKLASVFED